MILVLSELPATDLNVSAHVVDNNGSAVRKLESCRIGIVDGFS